MIFIVMKLQAVQDRVGENCCGSYYNMRSSLWGDGLEKEDDRCTDKILEARDW